ncbi:MAG: glutamate carboxypeptidase [Pseudohongiellaceae bacterium]|jgi:glutamate carboxypeptidase
MKKTRTTTCQSPKRLLALGFAAASLFSTAGISAESIEPALNNDERALVQWLDSEEDNMLELLEQLTNINSGSLNKAGVDAIGRILTEQLVELGFMTQRLPGELIEMPSCPNSSYNIDVTDHILASKPGNGKRLLLMGHMDTVFPPDSPFQTFSRDGDTMYGPGVADMQGGLVVMLYALKALQEAGELDDLNLSVFLNSDEEIGSLSSRKHIEEQAVLHDYGLVYESSSNDSLTRQRKGLGQARFVVNGKASHAGGAHEQGRSAIKELAYKIVEIEKITDYESGVTVNVGVISGGEARNTVAPCAEAFVDLRYPAPEQGVDAVNQFEQIFDSVLSYPVDSGELSTSSWTNLHRPPKIPTPESDYLLEKTRAIGRLLGQDLAVTDSGGGTDGSLSQSVGLPTLDSLGVSGTGAHSNREQARVSSLVERAKLSAVLIHRLSRE